MSSPPRSPADESNGSDHSEEGDEQVGGDDTITISDVERPAQPEEQVSEPQDNHHYSSTSSPSPPPAEIPPFDWEDFETRYSKALQEADEDERAILKEAEALSKVGAYKTHLTNHAC